MIETIDYATYRTLEAAERSLEDGYATGDILPGDVSDDIVAELDRWLKLDMPGDERGILRRARDEIVALRKRWLGKSLKRYHEGRVEALISILSEIFSAVVHDAEDEQKFCAGMGMNFEKIIGAALETYAAWKVAEERERIIQWAQENMVTESIRKEPS